MKKLLSIILTLIFYQAYLFCATSDDLVGTKAPEFISDVAWLNSKSLKLRQLRGKVVLVDFWEYTCVNCIRTLPYLKEWHKRYAKDGLVIIGVHTPEFEFTKRRENVARAVKNLSLEYPVALDNDYKIWNAYKNQYWPREFLVDKNGTIRYDHAGEGSYDRTEKMIQTLLREINPTVKLPNPMQPVRSADKPGAVCYLTTPELYAGVEGGHFGNKEIEVNRSIDYRDPARHEDGLIYLNGRWTVLPKSLRHAQDSSDFNDYIALRYHALDINAVMKPEEGEDFKVYVFQDGKPVPDLDKGSDIRYEPDGKSFVLVNEPRMYNLVTNKKFGSHEVRLATHSGGLGLYAFTFGTCEKLP